MPDPVSRFELFASCSPGTESVCLAELRGLGHREARSTRGGVDFQGSLEEAVRANLWLRTASRVLLRLGAFDAPGRRELAARARRLNLVPFIGKGAAVHLRVTAHKSRLYHTGLISEVFHEATGTTSAPKDATAPELLLRFEDDRCTVSIDTSGELLHRRGYRKDVSHAPLRETLAAALLLLCGYDGNEPLVDPMCGSGTIPIEAFLIATKRAPGLGRAFAIEEFSQLDHDRVTAMRGEATAQIRSLPAPIFGSDIHAGALSAARGNAERVQAEAITFERADVARRVAPAERGLVVTNPPYGKRIGGVRDRSSEEALKSLAGALERNLKNWRAGVLLPAGLAPPDAKKVHRLDNGGIPVELVELM